MKKSFKLYIFIISILVFSISMTSCEKDATNTVNENYRIEFLAVNNIAVYIEGSELSPFNVEQQQLVYTKDRTIYMVTNVEQTAYYSLTMDTTPLLGTTVVVEVASVGIASVEDASYNMKVVKEVGNKLWLWDHTAMVGIIVDFM